MVGSMEERNLRVWAEYLLRPCMYVGGLQGKKNLPAYGENRFLLLDGEFFALYHMSKILHSTPYLAPRARNVSGGGQDVRFDLC